MSSQYILVENGGVLRLFTSFHQTHIICTMLWCLGFIYIYYLKVGLTLYAGVKLKDHEAEGAT